VNFLAAQSSFSLKPLVCECGSKNPVTFQIQQDSIANSKLQALFPKSIKTLGKERKLVLSRAQNKIARLMGNA
jgi:hypothetical protein